LHLKNVAISAITIYSVSDLLDNALTLPSYTADLMDSTKVFKIYLAAISYDSCSEPFRIACSDLDINALKLTNNSLICTWCSWEHVV